MTRPPGWLTPILLAAPLALGCGETASEGAPPPPIGPLAQAGAQGDAKTKAEAAPKAKAGPKDQESLVTPIRPVDPQQLVDVVKEEVEGGEATEGPSPLNVLWLPADPKLILDKPMEVEVPLGLQPLLPVAVVPSTNPITEGKYELGRQLYFDPRVSLNGTVSCATCHDPARGWTDRKKTSVGIDGQIGARNAPTVLNTAYGKSMFWDGRAPSLEAQAQGPIQNPIEMGEQSYRQIVERLRKIPGYQDQFKKSFGTEVTLDGMAKAIATFERVAALSGESAYDRYIGGQGVEPDNDALTESQKRGLVLFGLTLNIDDEFKTDVVRQKAKCTLCHTGFNFTDEQFHNLGVGWDNETGRYGDLGRFVIAPVGAKDPSLVAAFKTPTLRDIERTAPYMHDGSERTLEEVVEFYDRGGNPNPYLDKDMQKLGLTDQEKADVVAFLKALTGKERKVELPKLPAGPDGSSPDPSEALKTPGPKTALRDAHRPLAR